MTDLKDGKQPALKVKREFGFEVDPKYHLIAVLVENGLIGCNSEGYLDTTACFFEPHELLPPSTLTVEMIDHLLDEDSEQGDPDDLLYVLNRLDCFDTDLAAPSSNRYESKYVATPITDRLAVAWVKWYGGDKSGSPEDIPIWGQENGMVYCYYKTIHRPEFACSMMKKPVDGNLPQYKGFNVHYTEFNHEYGNTVFYYLTLKTEESYSMRGHPDRTEAQEWFEDHINRMNELEWHIPPLD